MTDENLTRLTVDLPGNVLPHLDLPVEVRRPNWALVAKTLTSQEVELPPGEYMLRAESPTAEYAGHVAISAGQRIARAQLNLVSGRLENALEQPLEKNIEFAYGTRSLNSSIEKTLFSGHLLQSEQLRVVSADHLKVDDQWWSMDPASEIAGPQTYFVKDNDDTVALPLPDGATPYLSWAYQATSWGNLLKVRLKHDQAQYLLETLAKNALGNALLLSHSQNLDPDFLLEQKRQDPVAACLGAYVMLLDNELVRNPEVFDRLADRTRKLAKYNPGLSDAVCIHAECLARSNSDRESLNEFLRLSTLGLPLFTAGLNIACQRLGQHLDQKQLFADAAQVTRGRQLLRRLGWIRMHCELSDPILKVLQFDVASSNAYDRYVRDTNE